MQCVNISCLHKRLRKPKTLTSRRALTAVLQRRAENPQVCGMNPKATLSALVLLTLLTSFSPQRPRTFNGVWVPDLGDGTYKNPILYSDYSDPDLIRVRDEFYLIASSFNCTPGIPILHSKDLVNWRIISHVLKQQIPLDVFRKPQHGNGVWAPAIRYHDGV